MRILKTVTSMKIAAKASAMESGEDIENRHARDLIVWTRSAFIGQQGPPSLYPTGLIEPLAGIAKTHEAVGANKRTRAVRISYQTRDEDSPGDRVVSETVPPGCTQQFCHGRGSSQLLAGRALACHTHERYDRRAGIPRILLLLDASCGSPWLDHPAKMLEDPHRSESQLQDNLTLDARVSL
jgi:hypothetical protein